MMKKLLWNTIANSSTGLALVSVVFVGLKLGGFIDWAWGWVLLPVFIYMAVLTVGLVLSFIGWAAKRAAGRLQKHVDKWENEYVPSPVQRATPDQLPFPDLDSYAYVARVKDRRTHS